MKKLNLICLAVFVFLLAVIFIAVFCIDYTEPIKEPMEGAIHPPVPEEVTEAAPAFMESISQPKSECAFEVSEDILSSGVVYPVGYIVPEIPSLTITYVGKYQIFGYDTCLRCCGKTDGITSSGTKATVGRTVATNDFPIGTILYIEGIGERVVEDRGGMKKGVIDILLNNHKECYAITGKYDVYVLE